MLRNKLVLGALVAVTALMCETPRAEAGWWGRGSWGSHGSWGGSSGGGYRHHRHYSYSSSGGSWGSYGSSGGSYGGWGSSGGSSGGWSNISYGFGSWGSGYYGAYSSYGSSGGSSGGYGYYGSHGSSGGGYYVDHGHASDGVIIERGGKPPAPPEDAEEGAEPDAGAQPDSGESDIEYQLGPEAGESTFYRPSRTSALLSVSVPSGAKLIINGLATKSTGARRTFASRGLQAGNRYNYEVRAEIVRDGQTVTETKSVQLVGGQRLDVAFQFDKPAEVAKAKTTLTVNVPADAKLFLAGKEMKAAGAVRQFSTMKLTGDKQWMNYPIRVVTTIGGQEISQEQTVSLEAGQSREVTFDFGPALTASR